VIKALVLAGVAMMTALIPLPATAKPAARTIEVVVGKLAFGVVPPNLRVGDAIVWTNRDIFRHSATAPGHFDVDLPPGARVRMVFRRAGVFGFVCKYHPGMKGVVKVSR
jgi:plastocyanin